MGSKISGLALWLAAAMGMLFILLVVRELFLRGTEPRLIPTRLYILLPEANERVEITIGDKKAVLPVVVRWRGHVQFENDLPTCFDEAPTAFASSVPGMLSGTYNATTDGSAMDGRDTRFVILQTFHVGAGSEHTTPISSPGVQTWLPTLRGVKTWYQVDGNQVRPMDPGPLLKWLSQAKLKEF